MKTLSMFESEIEANVRPVKCGQLVYGINGDELMTMRVIAALDNTFICLCVSDTHGVYRYSYADYGEKVFGVRCSDVLSEAVVALLLHRLSPSEGAAAKPRGGSVGKDTGA